MNENISRLMDGELDDAEVEAACMPSCQVADGDGDVGRATT